MGDTGTRVLLIRHGANDYVKTRRLAGRTPGVCLNEVGRAEAEALAKRLAEQPITVIYASPLERTLETAVPLARQLGLTVHPDDGLIESNFGEWTGQAIDELSKADDWRHIQECPSTFRFPGGESVLAVQMRMVAAIEAMIASHAGQTVAVVSHSDPIKLAVAHYAGMPLDMFQRLEVAPASITELFFAGGRPRLVRLNDTAHVPPAAPETAN